MNPTNADASIAFEDVLLFSHLSENQRQSISNISLIRDYEEGECVFYEGEESAFFHLLIRGEVAIVKSSDALETIAIHRFGAPSMFAEMAALRRIPYPATARCMERSSVLKIRRDPFLELLGTDPALSVSLISSLTHKIAAIERSLQRHSAPNAQTKVARLLRDDIDILTRLKGVEIAHLLGIAPETLSRMLTKFKSDAIISAILPRGYQILDPVKIDSLAENNFSLNG